MRMRFLAGTVGVALVLGMVASSASAKCPDPGRFGFVKKSCFSGFMRVTTCGGQMGWKVRLYLNGELARKKKTKGKYVKFRMRGMDSGTYDVRVVEGKHRQEQHELRTKITCP